MKLDNPASVSEATELDAIEGADLLLPLVAGQATRHDGMASSAVVVVGELVAMTDEGRAALVLYPGQPDAAAVRARSVVDLHGAHIGRQVVLMFDGGNPARPIVMGVLRDTAGWPLEDRPGGVQVDADGERMVVRAKTQLVLRCGRASITLTSAGKVLVEGTYVSSRSTGVNRIKGGSIQLN